MTNELAPLREGDDYSGVAKAPKANDFVRLRPLNAVFVTATTWAVVSGGIGAAVVLLLGVQENAWVYWSTICGMGLLAAAVAVFRVRLEIDPYEVRVFNVLRTFRIPWTSVVQIDTVGLWPSPGTLIVIANAVRIRTRDGQRVVVDASNRETSRVLKALHRGRSQARVRSPR